MLTVARRKGVYRALHQGLIGDLPFADATFAGAVCSGVFTTGHAPAEALADLVRVVKPRGVVVATVKGSIWDEGMSDVVDRLVDDGRAGVLEVTIRYASMPGWEAASPSLAVVLSVAAGTG